MKSLIALFALLLAPLLMLPAQAQERPAYAQGQVWEYHTRPQDEGALLKIQQVEADPRGNPIYHVSLIGLHLEGTSQTDMPHLPVSRATLDTSVTRLSTSRAEFPDAAPGIRIWRDDNGGVFTISITEIVDVIQKSVDERPRD